MAGSCIGQIPLFLSLSFPRYKTGMLPLTFHTRMFGRLNSLAKGSEALAPTVLRRSRKLLDTSPRDAALTGMSLRSHLPGNTGTHPASRPAPPEGCGCPGTSALTAAPQPRAAATRRPLRRGQPGKARAWRLLPAGRPGTPPRPAPAPAGPGPGSPAPAGRCRGAPAGTWCPLAPLAVSSAPWGWRRIWRGWERWVQPPPAQIRR